jgi:hypothetical protein
MMEKWIFEHKFGHFELQSLGGMLGPVVFNLGNRKVSPMFVAPWENDPQASHLDPFFQKLRGVFPCVHFGEWQNVTDPDPEWDILNTGKRQDLLHGYSSHNNWTLVEKNEHRISIEIEYPADHPIRKLTRSIIPSPHAPALEIELVVEPRRDCDLPIGVHPTFRIPERPGSIRLYPADFKFGLTFPGKNIPESTQIKPNHTFTFLTHIQKLGEGELDLSQLPPTEPVEIILQLCGTDGSFSLYYTNEDYNVKLEWDKDHFPSCLLWMSYKAIPSFPWSSKTMALGVEPVNSAFDLGPYVSASENPISRKGVSTCTKFFSERIWKTNYRLSVYQEQ